MTNEFSFESFVQYEKNNYSILKSVMIILLIVALTFYFIYKIGFITLLIQFLFILLFVYIKKGPKKQNSNTKENKLLFNKLNFDYYDIEIPKSQNNDVFTLLIKNAEKVGFKTTDVKISILKTDIENIVLNSNDGAITIFYKKATMENCKKNKKSKNKNHLLFYIKQNKISDFKKYLKNNSFLFTEEDDKYSEN